MCSTYISPTETTEVKRWGQSASKCINFQCPEVVRESNKSMGGVDLSDMLISLYRTQVKTKRWYIKILFHSVNIAKANAWLLYKRHYMQLKTPKRKKSLNTQPEHKKRAASNSQPDSDVRLDCIAHWPKFRKEKRKCRYCKTGQSRVYCMKCDICLCLSATRNCFVEYPV